MAFEWFRSWHGAPTDSKYRVIAKRAGVAPGVVSAVYWALLDYASQNEPRGSVEGFDVETYAEWAGWEESDVQAIIDAFIGKQAIIDGRIVAWEKRQPKKEDDSTERVRAFRERQRIAELQALQALQDDDVTQGNDMKHDVTPGNYRLDKSTLDKNQRDEGLQRPPASVPVYQQEQSDPEHGVALSKLEALGMITGSVLLEFNALWPDLTNGRRAWVDDAVTVAQANNAHSPTYAIRVLAGALRDNKRPGSVPEAKPRQGGRTKSLDEILGITPNGK